MMCPGTVRKGPSYAPGLYFNICQYAYMVHIIQKYEEAVSRANKYALPGVT